MINEEALKTVVREKYAEIALQDKTSNASSCCGSGPCGTYTIMSDAYDHLNGYHADADLGLGCGLPTEFAHIQPGDTVVDLGSGAGNDCFVARAETGPGGKVIGIDFTTAMINLARKNADRLGYNNVEFREGDIETIPVGDASADVVVSNCVLNLVPNKVNVFQDIFRVLRPGGHFSISDVVLVGNLPEKLRDTAEMYAGCVSGAIQMEDYLQTIHQAGFQNVTVQKQKPILIPDEILLEYLSAVELASFVDSKTGIFSITVYAEKPGGDPEAYKQNTEKRKLELRELPIAASNSGCTPGGGCC